VAERTERLDATTQAVRTMEWDVEAALEHEELEAQTGSRDLVLGRYRLVQKLGSGGFGTVWAARDERLRRDVAVKVIPIPSSDRIHPVPARDHAPARHPAHEARVAARLNHPNVVALYELGEDDENVYLVSELVDGRTLAELIADDALSDRDIARIGAALCDGLAHAHERGVVHRDVKPQNVMVVAEPARGAGFAKLTDFGVAHLSGDEPLTRTGDVVGTLAYMAPEQAEGLRVTWEADVYSLALSLYEAWTGVNPVRRRGPAATARQLGKPIDSLGRMRKDLPAELVVAIDLALDPRPGQRPGPEELAEVLRAHARELSDEGALEDDELHESGARRRVPISLAARAFAGVSGGALVAAVMQLSDPHTMSVNPALAGAAAAVVVALLPRLGWIAAAVGLCAWLASPEVGQEGTAVAVACAALPVPLLLRRGPAEWSLPAFAALLAVPGLAPAYPAIAGQSPSWARRAALGGLGWLWIVLAGNDIVDPLPSALTAVAFVAASVLLPVLVRGLRPALDLIAAAVWAGALYAALTGIQKLSGSAVHPHEAAAGAALAGVLAVLAAVAKRSRRADLVP
jgi:hypothetical protein